MWPGHCSNKSPDQDRSMFFGCQGKSDLGSPRPPNRTISDRTVTEGSIPFGGSVEESYIFKHSHRTGRLVQVAFPLICRCGGVLSNLSLVGPHGPIETPRQTELANVLQPPTLLHARLRKSIQALANVLHGYRLVVRGPRNLVSFFVADRRLQPHWVLLFGQVL